jgi:hypothetical protein
MRMKKAWVLSVMLVLAPGIDIAKADKPVSSFGPEKPVTLEDYRPHLKDAEGYLEEWSHGVWLEDGTFIIGADFAIHNLNLTSDHDGRVSAVFKGTGGKETKCKAEYDDEEWSSSKTGLSLKFGKNRVSGDLKGIDLKVRCKDLKMDLRFENVGPPLRPGGGELRFGNGDGIYNRVFTCPRAVVTGSVTAKGQQHEIKGIGYVTHSYYDLRPDKNVHRWFRFKKVKGEVSIVMDEMEASKEYGLASNGWVLVAGPKGRILSTARVNFQYDGFIQDTNSDGGYKIPRRVRIAAVDGKTYFTGTLLMKKIQRVRDFTADMGAVKRAVVRRYTKPKDYFIDCQYKFRIKSDQEDRVLQGTGTYRFVYVNP